ncbi:MAG: hypothetical protein ACMVO3_05880 [Thalassobaculum sp.]
MRISSLLDMAPETPIEDSIPKKIDKEESNIIIDLSMYENSVWAKKSGTTENTAIIAPSNDISSFTLS